MKKLISLTLAAVFTLSITALSAQEPFFLNKVGAQAEYAMKNATGSIMFYAKSVVTSIDTKDASDYTIVYTTESLAADKSSMGAPATMKVKVKHGTVEMAPPHGGMGATIEGNLPSYPADLAVGQTFEYEFKMKIMGIGSSTKGKDRVVARENITTPAGTFDCFKIESDITVNAMGQNIHTKAIGWMAAGIGNVKTETYTADGKVQMVQELVELKK